MRKVIGLFCVVVLLCAVGCGTAESITNSAEQAASEASSRMQIITNNGKEKVFRDIPKPWNIEEMIEAIDGVEYASVVISGGKAVVSVELSGELEKEGLLEFKKMVERKVKQMDSSITKVVVNSCPGLVPLCEML